MNQQQTTVHAIFGPQCKLLAEHWDRSPFHCPAASPHGFADLLTIDDLDHIFKNVPLPSALLRVVRSGRQIDRAEFTKPLTVATGTAHSIVDASRVYDLFADGATVVLSGLHHYWPSLTSFCEGLEQVFRRPAEAYGFITPAGEEGVGSHHDFENVILLQLAGTKRWTIYPRLKRLPLDSNISRHDELETPMVLTDLKAGDMLYIPRGFPHKSSALGETSAHLNISIPPLLWSDVLVAAFERSIKMEAFRAAVPVESIDSYADLKTHFLRQIDELCLALTSHMHLIHAVTRSAPTSRAGALNERQRTFYKSAGIM